jgi:hypothetical protein
MIVESDGYRFDFTDAINAFKFDGSVHDTRMKAVDIIAEFPDSYVFVEIKEYPASHDPEADRGPRDCDEIDCSKRKSHTAWLKNYLKHKYRDSFLYRFAENRVDKRIRFLCLINFDNALNSYLRKTLAYEIPADNPPASWVNQIIDSCHVLNLAAWNRNFPNWPVQKI